jgi:hypothetical protein
VVYRVQGAGRRRRRRCLGEDAAEVWAVLRHVQRLAALSPNRALWHVQSSPGAAMYKQSTLPDITGTMNAATR